MAYVIYDLLTGKTIQTYITPVEDEINYVLKQGQAYVPFPHNDDYQLYFVKSDEGLTLRPSQKTVLEGNVISGIPVPATLTINKETYSIDEPVVELEFDQPGTYKIRIESWPFLDKEFTYENTSQ